MFIQIENIQRNRSLGKWAKDVNRQEKIHIINKHMEMYWLSLKGNVNKNSNCLPIIIDYPS